MNDIDSTKSVYTFSIYHIEVIINISKITKGLRKNNVALNR